MLGKTSLWVHAKIAGNKKNGRQAYWGIYRSTFGRHAMDLRDKTCRANIMKLSYTGPKRGFTFNDYVGRHKEQHAIKASLVPHGYNDFAESEKVSYLTDGIKTTALDVAVNAVLGDDSKRNDFEAAANHLADFVRFTLERERSNNRNISKVGTEGGRGRGNGRGNKERDAEAMKLTHIDKTYYPEEEYKNFDALEKHKVYLNQKAQKERGEWPPTDGDRTAQIAELSSLKATVSEFNASASKLTNVLKTAALKRKESEGEPSDGSDENDARDDVGGNRSNEALCRQSGQGMSKKSKH
jgi:hypothetical protein